MNKPNTLLKVTSILYIIFSIISGIVVIVGSLGIGALLGGVAGNIGAGIAMASFFMVLSLISVVLGLIAGFAGLKAENLKLCKTLGIVLIVLAAIGVVSNLSDGEDIVSALVGLILPILKKIINISKIKRNLT